MLVSPTSQVLQPKPSIFNRLPGRLNQNIITFVIGARDGGRYDVRQCSATTMDNAINISATCKALLQAVKDIYQGIKWVVKPIIYKNLLSNTFSLCKCPADWRISDAVFANPNMMVLRSPDGILRIWDPQNTNTTRRISTKLEGSDPPLLAANGKHIALGDGQRARIWDINGRMICNFEAEKWITHMILSPQHLLLFSSFQGQDGCLQVHEASSGAFLKSVPLPNDWFRTSAANDQYIVASGSHTALVWDRSTLNRIREINCDLQGDSVSSFLSDNSLFTTTEVSKSAKNTCQHWDLRSPSSAPIQRFNMKPYRWQLAVLGSTLFLAGSQMRYRALLESYDLRMGLTDNALTSSEMLNSMVGGTFCTNRVDTISLVTQSELVVRSFRNGSTLAQPTSWCTVM